jgi:hypothetical protein
MHLLPPSAPHGNTNKGAIYMIYLAEEKFRPVAQKDRVLEQQSPYYAPYGVGNGWCKTQDANYPAEQERIGAFFLPSLIS